uniref:Tyrosine-protein phosphatase non-receptor type 9 n=1 Tax=Eptatretus burgeri TaxID=7764 RepID=A0A8C4QUB4_EPTBU
MLQLTRIREGIYNLFPNEDPLKSELQSGKFTILSGRDATGAAVALFTARLHDPSAATHTTVLQAVLYQLDCAIESRETQRNGLIFIYDMTDSTYHNFDYELCVKMLSLLKGAFPARLKRVLIVSSPLWFRATFTVLRLFVREKLRDRVSTLRLGELSPLVPCDTLPIHLGGSRPLDHAAWLGRCLDSPRASSMDDILFLPSVPAPHTRFTGNGPPITSVALSSTSSSPSSPQPTSLLCEGSIHDGESRGILPTELMELLITIRRRGLHKEYEDMQREAPAGTFNCSKLPYNFAKNRYTDVLCLDHSRVRLTCIDDDHSDYINASFMDGYKQQNAYIAAQGPMPQTFDDFWRMVWEQQVLIVVMTTRVVERGRVKCGQYWPLDSVSSQNFGLFSVKNQHMEKFPDYNVTALVLYNNRTGEMREVAHFQYVSWPDFGVPRTAAGVLAFLGHVRQHQAAAVAAMGSAWHGHPQGPPIVVHCSAGIGRSGTFCTLDICLARLADCGTVDIHGTVRGMRSQRAFSIQTADQYCFCHTALLEHAQKQGLLSAQNWSPPDLDSESD